MTTRVHHASIAELQAAIAAGELTRVQILTAHLERIRRLNPLINSFVELRASAVLDEAQERDAASGRTLTGPLDGVPVSVKDVFAVAGLHRTNGLPVNAATLDAHDEVAVRRLRDAGAFVLGHAAIPDLCIRWNTISGLYGATRNPRDVTRSAGGSSGGDAANVAAGFATVGIGGDLGGSIRVPASFCGVYGFRPGAGRVPQVNENIIDGGALTTELMSEIGPLARSVADIETTFRVLAGFDRRDPASVDAELREPSARLPAVAVLGRETGARVDPAIMAALDDTVAMLRDEGYEVIRYALPDLHRAPEVWAQLLGTELLREVLPSVGDHITVSGRAHIEEMFGIFDLGQDVRRYLTAWRERRRLQEALFQAMGRTPLIVAAVAGFVAPPLDFDEHIGVRASAELFDAMRCVPWVNLFSLPSLALPNGIQIVGRRFEELEVLRAGYAVERRLPRVQVAEVPVPETVGDHGIRDRE